MAKKKRKAKQPERALTEVERAERVLAEMLNEAGKRGLKYLRGYYADNYDNPTACCALGALSLARRGRPDTLGTMDTDTEYTGIARGSDDDEAYKYGDEKGPLLGYAIGRSYRDALL